MNEPNWITLPRPEPASPIYKTIEDAGCFDCSGVEPTYMVHNHVWNQAWPTYKADKLKREHEVFQRWEEECRSGPRAHQRDEELDWMLDSFGRLFLCLPCLEIRLGRPLHTDDFVPDTLAPCNRLITLGVALGNREGSRP